MSEKASEGARQEEGGGVGRGGNDGMGESLAQRQLSLFVLHTAAVSVRTGDALNQYFDS